ncbi:hypothetical protein Riv7116_2612 [Rivularia sp. PCC 7116]|nr:hypothetical protein Riv7116_2612 [Rivularia sp. PCC 7116]
MLLVINSVVHTEILTDTIFQLCNYILMLVSNLSLIEGLKSEENSFKNSKKQSENRLKLCP